MRTGSLALASSGSISSNTTLDLLTSSQTRVRIGSAGRVLVGTTSDDNSNLLQVAGTAKIAELMVGAKRINFSATEPTSKAIGDLWWELDANGYEKWEWYWIYDGAAWRSPLFEVQNSLNARTFSVMGEGFSFFFNANSALNYHIKTAYWTHFSTVAHDASNRITFTVSRRNSANTQTVIGSSLTSTGNTSGTWHRKSNAIDTPINVTSTSTTVFSLDLVSNGSTGTNFFNVTLAFNYVRP
jgi:hypothetical protein